MENDQLPLFTGNKENENHNEQHIMFPAEIVRNFHNASIPRDHPPAVLRGAELFSRQK